MASPEEIVDEIAGFALFADLATPQLERVAHTFDEQVYAEGERVLRQGLSGSAFHVILEGDAIVVIDGNERATLARGDFFGEVSILLGQPPVADIVATRELRCLVLAGHLVQPFLLDNPPVMGPTWTTAGEPHALNGARSRSAWSASPEWQTTNAASLAPDPSGACGPRQRSVKSPFL